MRMRLSAVLAVVMAVMMVSGTALAADEASEDTTLHGAGVIVAKGKGNAVLDGAGKVRIAINGDVVIQDYAGDAVVHIRPWQDGSRDFATEDRQRLDRTTTYVIEDFRGVIWLRGSDFRLEADGNMKFRAKGKGTVHLDGRGWWKTRRARGTWSGIRIPYGHDAAVDTPSDVG